MVVPVEEAIVDATQTTIRFTNGRVSGSYRVVLMDFGIARLVESTSMMTQTGEVMGTPYYMSPEQAGGLSKRVNATSDVFSLGVVLYQLLTNDLPFKGESLMDILYAIQNKELQIPATLDRDLQAILSKAMMKEQSMRYGSALEFAEDCDRYLRGEPVRARKPEVLYAIRRKVRKNLVIVLPVCVALFLAFGYGMFKWLYPASIEIESEPSGAKIILNGEDTGKRTPSRLTLWPPGKHEITLVAEDILTASKTIEASAGSSLSERMILCGEIAASIEPQDAKIYLYRGDKKILLRGKKVPIGTYKIEISADGYQPMTDIIEVSAGAKVRLTKILEPEKGVLRVRGSEDGITMRIIPHQKRGNPPELAGLVAPIELPTGKYTLKFTKANKFTREKEIVIEAEKEVSITGSVGEMEIVRLKTGGDVGCRSAIADLNGDGWQDVIVGSGDSYVYAFSGMDWKEIWRFRTGDVVSSSPALAEINGDGIADCVVGSNDGNVYCISGKDGKEIWRFKTGNMVLSSPALADINGDEIADCVVGSYDNYVYCISGKDGKEIWRFKTGNSIWSSPALADINGDRIPDCMVGSWDSYVYCISGKDGKEIWRFKTADMVYSSPALTDINGDGIVDCVVGSNDGNVYCISGKDGKEIWRFKTRYMVWSSPALADINGDGIADCVVGSYDNYVYCISVKDGKEIWRFKTADMVYSSPSLTDINRDGIADCIVGSNDSNVYCISGKDGKEIWRFKTGNVIWSSPTVKDINGDGIVDCVIGSNDSYVYCISGKEGK